MSTKKKFTPEEIKHLKANPYTEHVTESTITYTLAFKETFWQLSLEGYAEPAAFRKLGYNTEILGFDRVHNTTKRLRKAAQTVEGFHGSRQGGVRIKREADSEPAHGEIISDEAARRMQREIMRLQQQMAFLKKVMKLHDEPEE